LKSYGIITKLLRNLTFTDYLFHAANGFCTFAANEWRMEKRIKIIHGLTIITLAALVALHGYWLFNRYVYSLQQYEEELFQKTLDVGIQDRELRTELRNKSLHTMIMIQWEMQATQRNEATYHPELKWVFDIYIVDESKVAVEKATFPQMDSLYALSEGVKKYSFEIKAPNREYDVHHALEQFQINELCPFTTNRFDSLLQKQGIKALSVKVETTDSMVWYPVKIRHTSIWNPVTEVTYPFNILQKEQVRVTYRLGISPILGRMFESLIGSVILLFLLVFCLMYQTRTIFKQQRVDELRKSFIKTMIHELKRPVATLKMCISFMKNDKMMQDKIMKADIIRSSQNELDNLSSYFSKLRDLTYGDMEEIPLNLSVFNLKELIDECVGKQYLPTDRKINISARFDEENTEIIADKMHVSNIFCNLLENAVKYSEGETSIHIHCSSVGDRYRVEVSDNGFGISSEECAHVFDKYFRSASITDKNIPGIGLGLCYVKLLTTAHKGITSLESTLGSGSKKLF
jgi:two-component system phosphate regulon sensor histidine kinase PhoR